MAKDNEQIRNYLLVYDRKGGRLVRQDDFGTNVDEAVAEYQRLERIHREESQYDIVLVGSDSIESVKVTHASYFRTGTNDLEAYLREAASRQGFHVGD